jgi:hypothetical protein
MLAQLRPGLLLGRLDEGEEVLRNEGGLAVEVLGAARRPTARGCQVRLDGILEVALVGFRHQAASLDTSILPVTAAMMSAWRYSPSLSMER